MKRNFLKLGIGIMILFFTLNVSAQKREQNGRDKQPPSFNQLIKEMDKNEDGRLAKAEVKGPLIDDFDKVDLDEDGFITEEEFEKAPKPKRRERQEK